MPSDAGVASQRELTPEERHDLVDQLTSIGVFQVNIGGGEPFIQKEFPDLLAHCHEKGLVTCVSTNGTLMDDDLAHRLSRLEMLYLQVSLDGATADVNDPIRGKGTYVRILEALDCLVRHKVRFSINTVLTRTNYFQLDDLRKMAGDYGAELRVSRFRPSGRARKAGKDWVPEKWQLEAFAQWLEGHDLVRTGDSFFCLTSEKRRRKGLDMCGGRQDDLLQSRL